MKRCDDPYDIGCDQGAWHKRKQLKGMGLDYMCDDCFQTMLKDELVDPADWQQMEFDHTFNDCVLCDARRLSYLDFSGLCTAENYEAGEPIKSLKKCPRNRWSNE